MKPATLDSPSPVKMRFGGLRIVAIRGSTSEYLASPVSNSKRSTGQMIDQTKVLEATQHAAAYTPPARRGWG